MLVFLNKNIWSRNKSILEKEVMVFKIYLVYNSICYVSQITTQVFFHSWFSSSSFSYSNFRKTHLDEFLNLEHSSSVFLFHGSFFIFIFCWSSIIFFLSLSLFFFIPLFIAWYNMWWWWLYWLCVMLWIFYRNCKYFACK